MRKVGVNLVAVGMAAGLLLGGGHRASAEPPATGERANGRAAVERLGRRLPDVAAANALTATELRSHLLTDASLFVDTDDRLLYVEPIRPSGGATSTSTGATTATSASVFTLHSAPGANRVIYLDFDGHTLSRTAWNNSTGRKSCYTDPYDSDGSPSSFSQAELDEIAGVWKRVAEDFAPFGVDVTTQEPAPDAINRSGSTDQVYGTRALITHSTTRCANNKTLYQSVCSGGCGGVAYVGVFDEASKHAYYQPALVFQNGVGAGQKHIAEAVSHEVGHNLGLSHDGTSEVGYYQGHGSWAPIMGVGYYRAITQWSQGEYAGANNRQDDFAVARANGAPAVLDDHPDSGTGSPLALGGSARGVVSARDDEDVFAFTVPDGATADVTVVVRPAATSPNLDVRVTLAVAGGATIATEDPLSSSNGDRDAAAGMDASITASLGGGTYLLVVEGVGAGDPATTGYSDYASVGAYTVELRTA